MKTRLPLNALAAFIMTVALLWQPMPSFAGGSCQLEWDCDVEGVGDEERCNDEALEQSDSSNYEPEYKSCGACIWLCRLDENSALECCAEFSGSEFYQCMDLYYEYTEEGDWRAGECSIIPVTDECVLTTGVCWEMEPPEWSGGGIIER